MHYLSANYITNKKTNPESRSQMMWHQVTGAINTNQDKTPDLLVARGRLSYNGRSSIQSDNAALLPKAGQMTAQKQTRVEEPSDRSDRNEPAAKSLFERSETSGYGKTINGAQRESSAINGGHGLAWQVFAGAELVLGSSLASAEEILLQTDYVPPLADLNNSRSPREKVNLPQRSLSNGEPNNRPSNPSEAYQFDPNQQSVPQPDAASANNSRLNQSESSQSFYGPENFGADFNGQNVPSTRSLMRFVGGKSPRDIPSDPSSAPPGSGKSSGTSPRSYDAETLSGASPAAQAFGSRGNGSQPKEQSNEPPAPDTFESDTETNMDARLLPNIDTVAYSGSGNATLVGNQRDNTIAGNTGDDTITGGAGNDQLIGGAGADVFVFGADDGTDQILDFSRGDKLQFDGLTNLNQIRVEELDEGIRVYFAETQVDLIGVYGLDVSADWISSSR